MEEQKQSLFKKPWVQSVTGIIVVVLLVGAALVWKSLSSHVSIDKSQISAPLINIGPQAEGILAEVYVKAGDTVTANEPLARVGSETLSAQVAGVVVSVQNVPGQVFQAGAPVVTMIDPTQLRVVGTLQEDKGLADVHVGQPVTFTVDAFGNQTFQGIVDEISPTSDDSGIVFSISDQREEKNFEVKVRYDVNTYPQFKNGMSAKIKVYIK